MNNALNDLQNYKSFVAGCVSDVSDFDSIKKLSDFAISEFQNGTGRGEIDIWINNAGKSQPNLGPLKNVEPDEIASVINTNLIGSLYCTKVAINVMEGQEHGGHIFLMDGAGSNGMVINNTSVIMLYINLDFRLHQVLHVMGFLKRGFHNY